MSHQDLVENIQPGVAQHMADNSLALLRFLSSDASPIPRLEHGFSRPRTVFFSNLNLFVMYSFTTAKIMYVTLFGASFYLVWTTGVNRVWTALGAVVSAFVGALIGANGVAFVMTNVLHKGMSWFREEYFPVILYGPAAIVGMWPKLQSCLGHSNLVLDRCIDQSNTVQQDWFQPNARKAHVGSVITFSVWACRSGSAFQYWHQCRSFPWRDGHVRGPRHRCAFDTESTNLRRET